MNKPVRHRGQLLLYCTEISHMEPPATIADFFVIVVLFADAVNATHVGQFDYVRWQLGKPVGRS